jgi:hypothetical protein
MASREPRWQRSRSPLCVICRTYTSAPGRIRTCDRRIRSPLLCPLSYGRIGLAYSHERYCSAGGVRLVEPGPGHLCCPQEEIGDACLLGSWSSDLGPRLASALGRLSVSQCQHERHDGESHAAEEIGSDGYEAGDDSPELQADEGRKGVMVPKTAAVKTGGSRAFPGRCPPAGCPGSGIGGCRRAPSARSGPPAPRSAGF